MTLIKPVISLYTNVVTKIPLGSNMNQYGIVNDLANASPDMVRWGASTLHASLPVHAACKPCLLNDNGTVNYYVKKTDVTQKLDGSAANSTGADGQCMTEIGPYWRMPDNYLNIHAVSITQVQGWEYVPKFFMGRYKATIQRSTNKLCSVVNDTADYRGGNNNAALDLQSNTLLKKPASSFSLINGRTYARNRGSVNWNIVPLRQHMLLYELYMIEFATKHSQKAVNTTLTVNGHKQGGLGDGFTTASSTEWNAFNGFNPACPCGTTDTLTNHWGEVSFTVNDFGGAGVNRTFKANRYLWIENPFGDIWEWIDGANIFHEAAGGTSKLYTCSNPTNFASNTVTNYDLTGNLPVTEGYVKTMTRSNKCVMFPSVVGGGAGSATYFCDYFYTPGLVDGWRACLRGGRAVDGAYAGFGLLNASRTASVAYADVGARLCYIP